MFETLSAEKLATNEISQAEASAISRIIGHSKETAAKCYVATDSFRAVQNCHSASKALGCDDENDENDEVSIQPAVYVPKAYGSNHPKFHSENCNRVLFSNMELEVLEKIVQDKKINNHIPDNIASICLKEIQANEEYISIFHKRHILNTARLRSALKKMGHVR